ncbi:Uncharacterised protein [Vibrio cholerae]|nr:Uncharacterised protein [Vibrio cholerae]
MASDQRQIRRTDPTLKRKTLAATARGFDLSLHHLHRH